MSRSHVLPLILAAAGWGAGAVASKHAVASIPPVLLLVVQLSASLVLMAVLARFRPPPRSDGRVVLLGLLNPGFAYLLNLAGLATITAGLSVMLWALEPVLIVAVAWLVLGQRLSPASMLISLVAVAGGVVAGSPSLSGGALGGVILTVVAVGCCAVYTVAAGEWQTGTQTVTIVAAQQAVALGLAGLIALVSLALGAQLVAGPIPASAWTSAVISGVLYYGLAFWAFLTGLRHTRAGVAGQFINLVPVFGVTFAWVLLDERLGPIQFAGGAVVVVAVSALISRHEG